MSMESRILLAENERQQKCYKEQRIAKRQPTTKQGNIVDSAAIQIYEKSSESIKIVERKRKNDDEVEINIEKKRIRASRQKNGNNFPKIYTRGKPQILTEVLQTMKGAKEEALRQMGFEFLKDNFDIDTAPTRLGYWVTLQFDPETRKIKMANGSSLKITANLIHEVLGIPNGGIPIVPVSIATTEDSTTRIFREKYDRKMLEKITIKTVANELKNSIEVDFAYKLDFLCLFCSLMGECTAYGTVNQLFFPSIISEDMICNLDWCSYLLECLISSRREWSCEEKVYKGSSLLLTLLYVHSTNSNQYQPERKFPAVTSWNTNLLVARQSEEEARGKFGDLPIAEGYEDGDQKMRSIFEEMFDQEDGEIIINRKYEERGLKGMKKNLKANFELIKILKENFESNLDKGMKNNPEDEWFKEMKVSWDSLFKRPMHSEEEFQTYVCKKKKQKTYEQEYEMYDGPSCSLGFTQKEIQLEQEAEEQGQEEEEEEEKGQQLHQEEEEKEQEEESGVIIINRKSEDRGLKVFYAHSINPKILGKETMVPVIKTWTSGMLMKLEEEFNTGHIEESGIQKLVVMESEVDDDVPSKELKDRKTSLKRKRRKHDTLDSCNTKVFEDANSNKEAPENVSDVEGDLDIVNDVVGSDDGELNRDNTHNMSEELCTPHVELGVEGLYNKYDGWVLSFGRPKESTTKEIHVPGIPILADATENAPPHFDSSRQSPPPTAQATSSQSLPPVAPSVLPAEPLSLPQTDSVELQVSSQCGTICVEGYNVKRSVAPILEAIFKKHGDIAAECRFKTASVRSNFLEVVCEVVSRIEADEVIQRMEEVEGQVSDAEDANINVSWLRAHLGPLHKRKVAMKLMETKASSNLVQSAAQMDLKEIREELLTAQKRFKKAERCVRVLRLVEKNIENAILETKAETELWVKPRLL